MPLGLTLVLVVATAIGPLLMCSTARSAQVAVFRAQVHPDYLADILAALGRYYNGALPMGHCCAAALPNP